MSISISNTVATPIVNSATASKVVSNTPSSVGVTHTAAKAAPSAIVALSKTASGASTTQTYSIADVLNMDTSKMSAVSISDAAESFSTNFAGLKALNDAKKIGSISLFQPATLTLDQSEVPDLSSKTSSSNSLLNKISSSYKLNLTGFAATDALAVTKPTSASSLTIKVTDTADNISANFAKLAKSSTVTQITSQNPDMALTVSAADYLANKDSFALKYSGAKFNLTNVTTDQIPTLNADTNVVGLNISDTGANVVTNLSAMQSAGTKVQSINVSDSKMSMDVATATNATNAAFLKNANFTGAIAVTVTGVTTGTDILSKVAQDAYNNTSANQNLTSTIRISDTATHIQGALDALDLMNNLNPGSIARVDVKDGGVLDFSNSDNFKLSSDLMKSFGKGYTLKIDSITAAEAVAFVPPTPGLTVQMTVQDSASNISANLDALAKTKSISAIVVQGGQSIDLSAQQYRSYAGNTGALNTKFFKVYDSTTPANNVNAHFNVNGATAADAAKIFADTTSESPAVKRIDNVTISDTGANIMKNIADLKAFDATVKLSSLTVSDGKLSLQASDVLAGNASTGTFLQNAPLSGPVNVTISNVETADVATVTALGSNANLNITQNVKDTTSGISQDDLDTLKTQSLAGAKFGTITASTNAGTVNGFGKYSDDLDIISKLSGVSLTINNVTAAQALDPNFSKTRGSIKVVDTADNISANFDALMKSSNIKTIEASGGNSQAISISFAQFNQYKGSKADGSDGALMLKAGTSANGVVQKFNIADATAASVTGIKNYAAGGSQGAMINVISVKDTGANIATSMAALNTALSASKLGTINVTDGSISKTSADMKANSNAFSDFVSKATFTAPVTLRVTGVALAADAVTNNSNIQNANVTVVQDVKEAAGTSGVASITSDEVNALENAVASGVNFGKIDVTNAASTDVVDFTDMAQFNRSADIVSKLAPTAKIKIESVSAADALTLTDPKFNLVVKDSAANISSNFAALMQQGSVKTVVADFGDAITVSAADFVKFKGTTDTGTIAKQGGGTTNSAIKDKMATSANGDVQIQTFNITDAKASMVGASGTANSFLAFNASDATGHAAGDMIKSISVTDTGANIAANISALSAASTKLSTVNATDGKLSLSEADTVSYTSFLGSDKFANALTLTVKDVDSAQHAIDNNGIEGKNSNISVVQNYKASGNLSATDVDDLMNAEAVGATIGKITLALTTNKASFTDMAQFNRSQAIVSQLAAGSKISIGSATVAEALDPKFQNKNFEFTIKDSAANISASFDKLMTNKNVTHVSADFSDAISITATQFNRYKGTDDAGTGGAISSKLVNSSTDYQKLDIKDALASQVSAATGAGNILAFLAGNGAGTMINSVSVKDTGAHVFASIGTTTSGSETLLSKASAANKLTTIELTDGKMTLASTDVYTSGSALNGKGTFLQNATFKNTVNISVSDVETADVGGVSGLTSNKNINLTQGVKDTTTDLSQEDLNSLEFALNSGTKLSSVSAPGEAVNVTNIDTYNNVKDVIAKLSGNPTIKFGSVTVAQALDPAFSGKKVEFTVNDTAVNISANIDQLMATKTVTQVKNTDQYKKLLGDVQAASTGNVAGTFAAGVITALGNGALGAIDGVTLGLVGDRVLLKDQTNKAQNGIYTVTTVGDSTNAYVLTRATDADTAGSTELALGNGAMVTGGATNIGQIFKIATTDTITPDTTELTFAAEHKISLTADQSNRYNASTDLKTKFITTPGLTSATGPAFDVQGLRADQVAAALGGHGNDIFVASASIKDTGAKIMAKLSDIQGISPASGATAVGALTGVTVTDGQLNLTEAQVKQTPTSSTWTAATSTSVLLNAQFKSGTGGPVTLNVTGVHAGNVTQIANNVSKTNGYKLQFNIVDNAADLSAAMTPVTLNPHTAVVAASVANIAGTYDSTAKTITAASTGALSTVDGVTLAVSDRVLLKDQTDATQNGVYTVSDDGSGNPYKLTRVSDFNAASAGSIETGATFTVSGGTANVNKTFGLSTKAPVLGSTAAASSALTFVDQNDPAAAAIYSANTVGDGSKLTSGLIKSIKIDPTPTSASPSTITLRNYADFMNNYDALKSIKENFTLQIGGISSSNGSGTRLNSTGGVSIAEYKAIAAKTLGANVNLQVVIKDAGSAITSPDNLDLLNSMVKAGKIVNVGTDGTRINSGTNALDGIQVSSTSRQINLTAAQLGKYQAVAKALAVDANADSRYVLNVTAAKATDVSRMVSDANYGAQVQNISIIDTRASIAGSVNSLAANSAKISSIALDPTDSTNPNPQMSVNDAKNLFGNVAAMAGVVNFQYNLIDSIAALNTQVETSATEKTVSRAANISVTDNLTVQLNANDMAAYNTYKDRITGNQPVVVGS